MRKGIYTATVAVAALVIMVSLIAATNQKAELETSDIYRSSMLEVKRQWQNNQDLLDLAVADAIADGSYESCVYSEALLDNTVYLQNLVDKTSSNCKVEAVNKNGPQNNLKITIGLKCEKAFGNEFKVSYWKDMEFKKETTVSGAPGACAITIVDKESGIQQYP